MNAFDGALEGGFPDTFGDYLEVGDDIVMKCAAFNRRGTLLAAGCSEGRLVIWDFDNRTINTELIAEDSVSPIMSISWSKHGHRILASAADKSLTLWDVVKNKIIARATLPQAALQVRLHPRSSTPSVCLVCPLSSPPMILHLLKETTKVLPVSLASDHAADSTFKTTAACFSKYGDLVYVGNSKGQILIIDHENVEILGVISTPGSPFVKNVAFSRNGQYLLTNSEDRTIRIYDNLLPVKDALEAVKKLHDQECDEAEKSGAVGRRCLALSSEIQDSKSRVQWIAPCFSGNGEWVVGGVSSMTKHNLYIWDRAGRLVKILEGPKERLLDIACHPVMPVVVSVSLKGFAYIWVKDYNENWRAFKPGYQELDENEEYVEREDEFDDIPIEEVPSPAKIDEDDIFVDITTIDKDINFSDSDMSQGEIQYLSHASILEEGDEKDVSESRLIEESGYIGDEKDVDESRLAEESREGHLTTNEHIGSTSPEEEETAAPLPAKRERRPTRKFWDFYMSLDEIQYLSDEPIPEEWDEKYVDESHLAEESGEDHVTTNDHIGSIPPKEEETAAPPPVKRERRPTSKFRDFYM